MKWITQNFAILVFSTISLQLGFIRTAEIPQQQASCKNEINGNLSDIECLDNVPMTGVEYAVASGWKIGVDECAHQFRWSRWNCSTAVVKDVKTPITGPGTRESGYVSAITSAGIVYSIAKACARGNISSCGCAPPTTLATGGNNGIGSGGGNDNDDEWDTSSVRSVSSAVSKPGQYWRWGGCSADVDYAVKLARKNKPKRESQDEVFLMMNFHNEKVGRNLIQLTLDTDCKCHGVSGSCTLKTCWLKLPTFRTIAEKLTQLYKQARLVRLDLNQTTKSYAKGNIPWTKKRKQVKPRLVALALTATADGSQSRLARRTELIYVRNSPNYCDIEDHGSWSWMGTHGRRCQRSNETSLEGSCYILCCGRGYNTHQVNVLYKCHCQFKWCCEVHCLDCQKRVNLYTCN